MEIPINKYKTNSIYVLSNGWFIDLTLNETLTTLRVKTPEGAVFYDFTRTMGQDITSSPENLKANIDSDITFLSSYLNEPDLKVINIDIKENPPLKETTNKIKIIGKVVTKEGEPIPEAVIALNFFSKPPPANNLPEAGTEFNSLEEFEAAQTNFESTNFIIGASALIIPNKFTKNDGTFEVELLEEDNVDFTTSYIDISKKQYFPKSIGPKLVKSGEITEKIPIKEESSTKIELNTYVVDESLFQQDDGNYRVEVILKNLDTGDVEEGIGLSQDREIAKKKARAKAEQGLARKIEKKANEPPVYTFSNGYFVKFETQGPKKKAIAYTPEGKFYYEGNWSFTAENEILVEELKIAIENTLNLSPGALTITKIDPPQPSPSPQQEDDKVKFDVYDIGRITLEPEKVDVEKEVIEAQIEVQKEENKVIKKQVTLDLPWEVRLTTLSALWKERLKLTLLPYVIDLLSKFGPKIIPNLFSGKKNPLNDKICLPADRLKEVLAKRNKLTRQINGMYKVVKTISKVLKVTNAFIIGLQIGTKVAQGLSAVPGPISPPFIGLKDLWNGLVEQGFYEVNRILERLGFIVTNITMNLAVIGFVIGYILKLLEQLDAMIIGCAEEIDPETGGFVLSFEEINEEIGKYKDPTTSPPTINDIIDPLTGIPFPYKGFTFEIKNDTSQNFQYPKRYAIARNIQGIQVLRSESSFASDPSILIEELKFVIDRDNLRAD